MNIINYEENYDELSWQNCINLLKEIPNLPTDKQIRTIEYLIHYPSPWIRQRAIKIGAMLLPENKLINYLRHQQDDVLRNTAIEILKQKGVNILSLLIKLLEDDDDDVVIQAILLIDNLKNTRAVEPLRNLLNHKNLNIVHSAILALGNIGDKRIIPDIMPFLHENKDPWLQVAAIQALGNLRANSAIKYLEKHLNDPFAGQLAAEAIAKIGGKKSLKIVVNYFLQFKDNLDLELILNLISQILEGLTRKQSHENWSALYNALSEYLSSEIDSIKIAAARSLISLGPGKFDSKALNTLVKINPPDTPYPCFFHRHDLIPKLISSKSKAKLWGFFLLSKFPNSIDHQTLSKALQSLKSYELNSQLLKTLEQLPIKNIASELLELFIKLPLYNRHKLFPLIQKNKTAFKHLLKIKKNIDAPTKYALELLIKNNKLTINNLKKLPYNTLAKVITQILYNKDIIEKLPWHKWIKDNHSLFIPLASQAAANGAKKLLPSLRNILKEKPVNDIIKAIGALKDKEGVPLLISHLSNSKSITKALIIEALGKIGTPEAKAALYNLLTDSELEHEALIYQALAHCANQDDLKIFQQASHIQIG